MPRPVNALIVDDEPHVRLFVRLLLREVGISQTWEAADGNQALQMIEQYDPQLVLLDINLPLVSGPEILEQMHEVRPEIPVIMVTAQSAMKSVMECAKLGAIAYILKHSPRAEALKMLREAVDGLATDEA